MDGRGHHRALLSLGLLVAIGWFATVGSVGAQQPGSPSPAVAAPAISPTGAAAADAMLRKRMTERRQRELGASEQDVQRRIDQLPPDEREAFKRNLRVWRQLTPEERESARKEAADRTHEEVERAYGQSGLRLDKDQREVFGLRYRQERRKLERELQEKMDAERTRRLPAMVEELKKEFADKTAAPSATPLAVNTPTPTPAARMTPSVSVPATSPTQTR